MGLLLLDRVVPSFPSLRLPPYLLLLRRALHSLNSLWCTHSLCTCCSLNPLYSLHSLCAHQTCWINRPCIPCTPWGPSGWVAPISLVSLEFQLLLVLQLLPLSAHLVFPVFLVGLVGRLLLALLECLVFPEASGPLLQLALEHLVFLLGPCSPSGPSGPVGYISPCIPWIPVECVTQSDIYVTLGWIPCGPCAPVPLSLLGFLENLVGLFLVGQLGYMSPCGP